MWYSQMGRLVSSGLSAISRWYTERLRNTISCCFGLIGSSQDIQACQPSAETILMCIQLLIVSSGLSAISRWYTERLRNTISCCFGIIGSSQDIQACQPSAETILMCIQLSFAVIQHTWSSATPFSFQMAHQGPNVPTLGVLCMCSGSRMYYMWDLYAQLWVDSDYMDCRCAHM